MIKSLTEAEIKGLYFFTKVQNIPYEDVQHEIVDHLASAIESNGNWNHNDSFRKRLKEYTETLPQGFFNNFEKQYRSSLTKLWWSRFRKAFTIKTMILCLTLSIPIYFTTVELNNLIGERYESQFFIFILLAFQFFVQYNSSRSLRKNDNSKQLITFHFMTMITVIYCVICPILILLIDFQIQHYSSFKLVGIILMTILISATYILSFILPRKLKKDIVTKYSYLKTSLT